MLTPNCKLWVAVCPNLNVAHGTKKYLKYHLKEREDLEKLNTDQNSLHIDLHTWDSFIRAIYFILFLF